MIDYLTLGCACALQCLRGTVFVVSRHVIYTYRGADKSLARPGRKQATPTEDFEFHISYL